RDGDFRTVVLHAVKHEVRGDRDRHHRHYPHQAEEPPAPYACLRDRVACHRSLFQMSFGSKLCDASMVSTTTQVNATSPGPGITRARSPSLTSATSTASRNTSSIAQGPIASMNLKMCVRARSRRPLPHFTLATRKVRPSSLSSGMTMLARNTTAATKYSLCCIRLTTPSHTVFSLYAP